MVNSVLDNDDVRAIVFPFPAELYRAMTKSGQMNADVELIKGVIVKKMSKSPLHSYIFQKLSRLFNLKFGDSLLIRTEQPLSLKDSEPEPDIAVIRGTVDEFVHSHPSEASLVIEISVTSLRIDLLKCEIYAEAMIPEYWIINAESKSIEVYSAPESGNYKNKKIFSMESLISYKDLSFNVGDLFPRA